MADLLKHYAWVLHVFFVLCFAYFLAKITNVYVSTLLEVPRSIAVATESAGDTFAPLTGDLSSYDVIIERNIFDSEIAESVAEVCKPNDERPECSDEQKNTKEVIPTGEAVKTSLPIKVLATVAIGDGKDKRSSAAIDAGRGKGIDVYAVRDPEKVFSPGVELIQVKPKRIEFLNNGRLEYAEIEEESSASLFVPPDQLAQSSPVKKMGNMFPDTPTGDKVAAVGDNKFLIDQAEVDASLGNLDMLYTQIRAVPNFEGGEVKGMKILSIKPGSIFSKLGIRRGDVLDRINGQQIDIKSGFALFSQLRSQKSFSLDLIRGGKTESFEYEIR